MHKHAYMYFSLGAALKSTLKTVHDIFVGSEATIIPWEALKDGFSSYLKGASKYFSKTPIFSSSRECASSPRQAFWSIPPTVWVTKYSKLPKHVLIN